MQEPPFVRIQLSTRTAVSLSPERAHVDIVRLTLTVLSLSHRWRAPLA